LLGGQTLYYFEPLLQPPLVTFDPRFASSLLRSSVCHFLVFLATLSQVNIVGFTHPDCKVASGQLLKGRK
jgi:hypothetical protein